MARSPTSIVRYIEIRQGASTLTIPPPPPDGSNDGNDAEISGRLRARRARMRGGRRQHGDEGRRRGTHHRRTCRRRRARSTCRCASPWSGNADIGTQADRHQASSTFRSTVAPTDDNATFTHIEEGLEPSRCRRRPQLDDYIVYIGFDPHRRAAQDKQQAAGGSQVKPKPKPKPDRASRADGRSTSRANR